MKSKKTSVTVRLGEQEVRWAEACARETGATLAGLVGVCAGRGLALRAAGGVGELARILGELEGCGVKLQGVASLRVFVDKVRRFDGGAA